MIRPRHIPPPAGGKPAAGSRSHAPTASTQRVSGVCRRPVALALCLVVLASHAVAAGAANDLTRFRSRRYNVVTNLPVDRARPIARHMDQVFDEYTRRLGRAGFRQRAAGRMNLYLLDTQANYVSFLQSRSVNAGGTGGVFFVRGDLAGLATFVAGQNRTRMLSTLQHEGFHQFAYIRIGHNLPPWANEGLAEYFGEAVLLRGRFHTGMVNARRLRAVQQAVRADQAFGFRELLNMSNNQWTRLVNQRDPRAGLLYDQAWSIVHFLVHARDGRYEPAFMRYLQLIHRGRDSDTAFAEAFGSNDYQPFEKAWRDYVTDLEPDPLATAIERLGFIAEGARLLHEAGRPVRSIEQLRSALQDANFWYRVSAHGASRTFHASNDKNFQPPDPDKRGRATRWSVKPSDDPNTPPIIGLVGLDPTPHVRWFRDDHGKLSYEVVFE